MQARLHWEPARRIADLADQKQQWHTNSREHEGRQQSEEALHRLSRSGAPSSSTAEEPAGRRNRQ
eukprot:14227990-Heterocapsa_arctica.AAC.1